MNLRRIATVGWLALLCAGLSACKPAPAPTEQKPDPKATELRQAIQEPLDRARAAEQATQQAADRQKAAMEESEK